MRVVLISETYRPDINGVATTWGHLVDEMRRRGHRCTVVRPRAVQAPLEPDVVCVPGVATPIYPQVRLGLATPAWLASVFRERSADVVHVATEGPLGLNAVIAARRLGLPVTSSYHTHFVQYADAYRLGILRGAISGYLRWLHNSTACTLAPTEDVARVLRRDGYRCVSVLPRGVDIERFSPAYRSEALRRAWGIVPGERVALYVGRLAPEKSLRLALEAFDGVAGVRTVIVGNGPDAAGLRRRCRNRSDVVFWGRRSGDELAACYASADLFAFPSMTETFGNVVLEAMASGLPVVAFDHAAARAYVDASCGRGVPMGDEGGFVRACRELLMRAFVGGTQGLESLGFAARERVLGLRWGRVADVFEAALAAAQAGSASAGSPASLAARPLSRAANTVSGSGRASTSRYRSGSASTCS